jgi:thymidylate synthase (FAD)
VEFVEPKVFLVGETRIVEDGLAAYLKHVGAPEWSTDAPSDSERLCEVMGRLCYRSFKPGLNPNVTRVREGNDTYLAHIMEVGHGSVIEHAVLNFIFADVSRVFTHELVRHRAGVAISQESLRYVRQRELRMTLVPGSELARLPNLREITMKLEEHEESYLKLAESLITDGMSFDDKKAWTSALRRVLPDGIATNLVWSANHRAMRWILEMRTAPGAEVEMRYVFDKVGRILQRDYPMIFGDFERKPHADGVGAQWVPRLRSKV